MRAKDQVVPVEFNPVRYEENFPEMPRTVEGRIRFAFDKCTDIRPA